jgi:TRAP-type C4-dicarboxylate transport system substrate-binding protein
MVFMAKRRYDALSPAARKILDDNAGEAMSRTLGAGWDEEADMAREKAKADSKQQVVTPTAEQTETWKQIVAPVTADWVKNTPGGDKVLDAFHTYLTDVKAGH